MRGSEYLALRVAACTAALALGGGIVLAAARWVLPWLMGRVAQAFPGPAGALAGIVAGMAVVVLVSSGLRAAVGYILLRIDRHAGGSGITDEDGGD